MKEKIEFLDDGGVLVILSGKVSREEIMAADDQVQSDPRYQSSPYSLWWFKDIESFDIDVEDIEAMADKDRRISSRMPPRKIAVVCDLSVGFGLGRMYELLLSPEHWQVQVFRDLAQAEAWVRIPLAQQDQTGKRS